MIIEPEKKVTMWLSKFALTKGVEERVGFIRIGEEDRFRTTEEWRSHTIGKEAHTTRSAAVARADQMRLQKIASLEKQIEKLRKLKFE